MRETRQSGSEGGEAGSPGLPYPYSGNLYCYISKYNYRWQRIAMRGNERASMKTESGEVGGVCGIIPTGRGDNVKRRGIGLWPMRVRCFSPSGRHRTP